MKHITVIGGGISGVSLSTLLAQHTNYQIVLLEKARRLGGRATLLPLGGSNSVAIGTQTFALNQEVLKSRAHPIFPLEDLMSYKDSHLLSSLYELQPNIWSKAAHNFEKQEQVDLMLSHHVKKIWRDDTHTWIIEGQRWKDQKKESFVIQSDRLVLTLPPQQTLNLLAELPFHSELNHLLDHVRHAQVDPRWVVVIKIEPSFFNVVDQDRIKQSKMIKEIYPINRELNTDLAEHESHLYVIHMCCTWSLAHLEDSAEMIVSHLTSELNRATDHHNCHTVFEVVKVHRWRYALTHQYSSNPELYIPSLELAICGDAVIKGQGKDSIQRALQGVLDLFQALT